MSAIEVADLLSEHMDRTGRFSDTTQLELAKLRPSDSPRINRTNAGYVRILAESAEQFPPIIVHRESMRVIDGNQRVEAARLRGETTIPAVLFDGDDKAAFVLAVRLNVAHGLPLTIAERKAAAVRLLADHPEWSDRSIAAISGISDKTVGMIRRHSAGDHLSTTVRIGRNGIAHRTLNQQGRHHAAELLRADPTTSLREVAAEAGISLTTAKDVRSRLRRGDDPIPAGNAARRSEHAAPAEHEIHRGSTLIDPEVAMKRLSLDPSLRFTEAGRNLLRWLSLSKIDQNIADEIAANLPGHCVAVVTELAQQRSDDWRRFAQLLADAISGRETAPAAAGPDKTAPAHQHAIDSMGPSSHRESGQRLATIGSHR